MSEIQTDKNPQNTSDNCLISNMSQQESVMANNGKETGEMDGENVSSVYTLKIIKIYLYNFKILIIRRHFIMFFNLHHRL